MKNFQGSEILPYLQASKLTITVSWMLAEEERFLSQKQRALLLAAEAVAKVKAFAYIRSSSPSFQSVT